jgi:hypothetical protein
VRSRTRSCLGWCCCNGCYRRKCASDEQVTCLSKYLVDAHWQHTRTKTPIPTRITFEACLSTQSDYESSAPQRPHYARSWPQAPTSLDVAHALPSPREMGLASLKFRNRLGRISIWRVWLVNLGLIERHQLTGTIAALRWECIVAIQPLLLRCLSQRCHAVRRRQGQVVQFAKWFGQFANNSGFR